MERVSKAIGMSLGLPKCATACLRKGKPTSTSHTLDGEIILALAEGKSYKYLGINQVMRAHPEALIPSLVDTYVNRLKTIWEAPLNARNKVHATNIWAVSLFRYYFSTLKWNRTQLVKLDRLTRATLRKYLPRCVAGVTVSS